MQGWIWPRLGAVSGLLFVVLLFGFTSSGIEAEWVIIVELGAMLLFLPFLGYLYSILRRAEGEGGWLSITAFGAGHADLTIKLGSLAPGFASRTKGLDPQLHEVLEKMNSVAFIVTVLPIDVMMAAVAIVAIKTRVLPLWLGLLVAITAPICLVNGTFLDAEFGPAFLLFLLWTALASVVLTLRAGKSRATATATPEPARVG